MLPKRQQQQVLKLAHDMQMGGHLGKEKTARRILQRFYWPTICQNVSKHYKRCPECHLTKPERGKIAPLIQLPIIREPFKQIAMDVVGPLLRTKQGHQYLLVICDYATRYPEAYPLKMFTASAVITEFVDLFSRHGIPEEILNDQGTNFMSQLLQEFYKVIGV